MVLAVRSGSASTGYPVEDRVRGGFRLGAQWGMSPSFTVGLAYERVGAGRERAAFEGGYASDTRRTLDAILASVRIYPFTWPAVQAFFEIDLGFSRESADQAGVRLLPQATPYRCSATSSGSLALGPAIGVDVTVAGPVALVARAYATFHRLGDDTLTDDAAAPCVAGAGTMMLAGVSLGLAYRFDLGHLRAAQGLTPLVPCRYPSIPVRMELEIGIVCGVCDTYSPMGTARCVCGNDLAIMRQATSIKLPAASPVAPAARLDATVPGHAAPAPSPPSPPSIVQPPPTEQPTTRAETPLARQPGTTTGTARGYDPRPRDPAKSVSRPTAPDLRLDIPADPETNVRLRSTTAAAPAAPPPPQSVRRKPPSYAHLSQEELMEQARHYLCWQCYTPVPSGHKFCGRCGGEIPPEIMALQVSFFSEMQNPAKARIVVIRGEGTEGLAYHLKQEQHLVGRRGGIEFPDDPFISPKHANFFYRDSRLFVRDEGSLNGVYLRVRGSVDIAPSDTFLAGEQVFRLDQTPRASDGNDPDGTAFYSSPKYTSPFRITQLLQGGALGMTVCARGSSLQLGREGGDLNFPADIYMSGSHCRIEESGGKFTLTDLNSRNGTYVRLKTERELGHGDYLFLGRKLIRVELNS